MNRFALGPKIATKPTPPASRPNVGNAVVEINVVGQHIDPGPTRWLVFGQALPDRRQYFGIGPDLRMAGHAGMGRRHPRVLRDLDRGVAVPAIEAQAADVMPQRRQIRVNQPVLRAYASSRGRGRSSMTDPPIGQCFRVNVVFSHQLLAGRRVGVRLPIWIKDLIARTQMRCRITVARPASCLAARAITRRRRPWMVMRLASLLPIKWHARSRSRATPTIPRGGQRDHAGDHSRAVRPATRAVDRR
jgi:hypothetical protein